MQRTSPKIHIAALTTTLTSPHQHQPKWQTKTTVRHSDPLPRAQHYLPISGKFPSKYNAIFAQLETNKGLRRELAREEEEEEKKKKEQEEKKLQEEKKQQEEKKKEQQEEEDEKKKKQQEKETPPEYQDDEDDWEDVE